MPEIFHVSLGAFFQQAISKSPCCSSHVKANPAFYRDVENIYGGFELTPSPEHIMAWSGKNLYFVFRFHAVADFFHDLSVDGDFSRHYHGLGPDPGDVFVIDPVLRREYQTLLLTPEVSHLAEAVEWIVDGKLFAVVKYPYTAR